MLTNILLLPLCFRQKTGHLERSFFPGVRAGCLEKFPFTGSIVIMVRGVPSPISLSFKKHSISSLEKALGTLQTMWQQVWEPAVPLRQDNVEKH